ncbi:MAG TPA: hypothetical protein VJ783_02485 [Pirellulales bacterium]|nr:hypothetical protein [Pirellulales bacterium]
MLSLGVGWNAAAAEPPENQPAGDSVGLMYWTDRSQGIYRAVCDGSEVTLVVEMKETDGLAVDAKHGKLYFTTSSSGKLFRANLDGTEITELVAGLTHTGDVVLDPKSEKLYISSLAGHKILQCNLDGTGMKDFVRGLITPDELAIDLEKRFLYWSHSGRGGPVQRARLDNGLELTDVVATRARRFGIVVDTVEQQIYWADVDPGNIVRSGLDGQGQTTIVTGRVGLDGLALDTDNRKIYWTETGKICRANLDGSGIAVLVSDKTQQWATLVILPPKEQERRKGGSKGPTSVPPS